MSHLRSSRFLWLPVLAALGVFAAACGSSDGSSEPAASPPAPDAAAVAVTADGADLSGVKLRVGDQADEHLTRILEASGELDGIPYEVEWSTFQNGPQLIAAATGGSLDLGKLSETPLVFAQAAGSPVHVAYAAVPEDPTTSSLAIAVPADSELRTVADLKGKKVGYAKGTVLEYLLANALDQAGLDLGDVQAVALGQGVDPLASGDADAVVTGDPTLSAQLAAGKVRILESGADYTPGVYYLVTRDGVLDDPRAQAAVGDLLARITRAQAWWNTHVDQAAAILAADIGYEVDVAKAIIERSPVRYGPIGDDLVAAHQAEVDFFVDQGTIDATDAGELFDRRFGA